MKHFFFSRVSAQHAVRQDNQRVASRLGRIAGCVVWLWLLVSQSVLAQCQDLDVASTLFQGLGHVALGQAQLSVANEVLTVNNLGSSGSDGTTITLGDGMGAPFVETSIDLASNAFASGDRITLQVSGPVSGLPETFIEMRLDGVGSDIKVQPIFRNPQVSNYRALLSNNGHNVALANNLAGQLTDLYIPPSSHLRIEIKAAGAIVLNALTTPFVWQDPREGPQNVTRIALTANDPPDDARLCTVSWKGQHLERFDITQHRIGLQNLAVQTLGNATVDLTDDTFELSNLGFGANEGAIIDTQEAVSWEVGLMGMDPSDPSPGSWLEASSIGTSTENGPTTSLGIRWEAQDPLWHGFFEFAVDQSTVPYTLEILSDGMSESQTGPLVGLGATFGHGSASSWSAELDPQTGAPMLRLIFATTETITPTGGAPILGNEIRVRPSNELGLLTLDALQGIRIRANGISKVNIQNAKSKKQEQPRGIAQSTEIIGKACKVIDPDEPLIKIMYFLDFTNMTNELLCFEIRDEPRSSYEDSNSSSNTIDSLTYTKCVRRGATCQVGYTGWIEKDRNCTGRSAVITSPNGGLVQIMNESWLNDLGDCDVSSIQVCEDDLISSDGFETGDCSQWSATVGAALGGTCDP